MSTPEVRCAALLLAAGRGRRFDPTGHQDKLLQHVQSECTAVQGPSIEAVQASSVLPAQASSVVPAQASSIVAARACASLAAGSDAVLAVVRPQAPIALQQALREAGACVTVCEDADLGMGHSLAHAVREARARWPHLQALLVMPADMPWVQPVSVQAVAQALVQVTGAQPACGIVVPVTPTGQRGHPVGFDARHFDALAALQGDAGARHLLQSAAVERLMLEDPGIVRDVDTAQDLSPTTRI